MTVAAQTPTISYTENGSTTAFAVPFRYDSPSDLKAVRRAADGTETVLVNGTDFTASPGPTNAGGTLTVTAAAASGVKLTIFRDTARTQPADYINNGAFTADSHERALDKAMLVIQEQDVGLARAVKGRRGEVGPTLRPLAELDGKILGLRDGEIVPTGLGIDDFETTISEGIEAVEYAGQVAQTALANDQAAAEAAITSQGTAALAAIATGRAGALSDIGNAGNAELAEIGAAGDTEVAAVTAAGAGVVGQLLGASRTLATDFAASDVTIGATAANVNTLTSTTISYGPGVRTESAGYLRTLSVRLSAAGTGAFLIVDATNRVIFDLPVTVTTTPETFDFSSVLRWVPAGCAVLYRQLSGGGLRSDNAAGRLITLTNSTYDGTANDPVTLGSAAGTPAVSMTLASLNQRRVEDRLRAIEAVGASVDTAGRTRVSLGTMPTGFWNNFTGFKIGYDAGVDLPVGATLDRLEMELLLTAGCDSLRWAVWRRPTASADIDTPTAIASDVLLASGAATVAALGLVTDGVTLQPFRPLVGPIAVEAGFSYFIAIDALTTALNVANFGVGNASISTTRQRRRGWFNAGNSPIGGTTVASIRFGALTFVPPAPSSDRIVSASVSATGFTVNTALTFSRSGSVSAHQDSRTLTAAPASNVRYDVLVFDCDTLAITLLAGTNTAAAPIEFIPSPSAQQIVIAHLRVTPTWVSVIPRWEVDAAGAPRQLAAQQEAEDDRNRACIGRFRRRVAQGASVRILSIGDSIVAQEIGGTSLATPNGTNRDRAAASGTSFTYLRDNIPASIVNAVPLFTSAQLGRTADGLGAVYTRTSMVWEMVAELERMGLTLGSTLFYDNFCKAGMSSTDMVTNGLTTPAATAWLTAALALAPDLVVFHFGMNPDASVPLTRANLIFAAQQFRAIGTDVVMIGRAKRAGVELDAFINTNRAIREAAFATGSALVDTVPIYDARTQTGGFLDVDACSANNSNHPGLREHRVIGEPLRRMVRL